MNDPLETVAEPANLKLLRRLVTILLVVMILGFITLIALFVMRFSPSTEISAPTWPSELAAPAGANIIGLSKTPEFYALITDQNQILIFDLDYNLIQTLPVTPN